MIKAANFDVDIDLANRDDLLKLIPHVPAAIDRNGELVKHNTGVYLQNIPHDPVTGLSDLDHVVAAQRGYFKLDFLNNHVYAQVHSPEHLDRLCEQEPMWELLTIPEIISTLYHIHGHVDLVISYAPSSVDQLSMLLAMIRPAKRHLIGEPWETIQQHIWTPPQGSEYYFKRSHAVAFSMAIVVQMNLLVEQANQLS